MSLDYASFEILYKKDQVRELGESFCSFDVSSSNISELREIVPFSIFAKKKLWLNYELSGIFSPSFLRKMGITEEEYCSFVSSNLDADVILFHPFPEELSIANDFLELAELEHAGLTEILSSVWSELFSEDLPVIHLPDNSKYCCHCNYFLGSKKFWDDYSKFILEFYRLINMDKAGIYKKCTPYLLNRLSATSIESELPIAVFVFERSLSHFLMMKSSNYKVVNFSNNRSGWTAVEVFPGERDFVSSLKNTFTLFDHDIRVGRSLAVHAYHYYRRLWMGQ